MRPASRLLVPLSLMTLVALIGSACGGGDATSAPSATKPPPQATATARPTAAPVPTPTPPPTPTAGPDVKRGGTIIIPTQFQLQTPDPSKIYNFTTHYALGHVWSTLLKFKDRVWSDTEVEGDLAASWDISPDGKVYTFKINPSARWQNVAPVSGRPVTAADIKWTWDLENDRIVPSYGSAYRSRWPDAIDSMDAVDAKTLVVKLKAPFAPLTQGLANSTLKVLPREVFELDKEFGKNIVGSGAFQYAESNPTVRVRTRASVNYWKMGTDSQALPYVDAVEQVVFADNAALIAAIKGGQAHFNSPSGVTLDQAIDMQKTAPNVVVIRDYNLYINLVRINNAEKPWDNEKARQGIMRAIDQQRFLNDIWRQSDAPLNGPVAAGIQGWELPQDELKQLLKYDLTEAKRLIQEGGAAGVTVKLLAQAAPREPVGEAAFAFINQALNDAGIKSELFIPPGGGAAGSVLLQDRKYTVAWGTFPFEGNAWNWVRPNWYSNSSNNFFNVKDPALDKMIDDAEAEVDPAKQQSRVKDLQRYILQKAYSVPVVNGWIWVPQSKALKNYARTWPWGHNGLEHAWLER